MLMYDLLFVKCYYMYQTVTVHVQNKLKVEHLYGMQKFNGLRFSEKSSSYI